MQKFPGQNQTCFTAEAMPGSRPPSLFFFLTLNNFFLFSIIVGLQCSVNFPLYSKVTQSHIHIYILFLTLSSIMLHRKWLDIVPSAIQPDLTAYQFQRQQFASINPGFPVHLTPSSTSLATTSLFSNPWVSFLWKCSSDSRCKWNHMVFIFLFLTYFTQDESF